MGLVTFLVTMAFIGLLIVCGVIVNMYLYSQGAFRTGIFKHSHNPDVFFARQKTMTRDRFSLHPGTAGDEMSNYVKRVILTIFIVLFVIGVIVALYLNSVFN